MFKQKFTIEKDKEWHALLAAEAKYCCARYDSLPDLSDYWDEDSEKEVFNRYESWLEESQVGYVISDFLTFSALEPTDEMTLLTQLVKTVTDVIDNC